MTDIRTYVIDTSVLLSDPWACSRFAEHEVVVPLVVISELEAKRHHHELGWFARQALRLFDDLRLVHGRLDQPIPVGTQGGTLHVELNHTDPAVLPAGFRNDNNDCRILSCAANLAAEGKRVTLVSKDIPLRVKAAAVGLAADEYHAQDVVASGWSGMREIETATEDIDALFSDGEIDLAEARDLPCHTGIRLLGGSSHALGRVNADKRVQLVRGDREVFGLRGRSAEQRVALDLLLDESVGIVSLGGKAGTGKSALALCAGLEAVLERRTQRKVVVFRPLYAVGGQELGYRPAARAKRWARGRRPCSTPSRAGQPGGPRGSAVPRHARSAAADPHPGTFAARLVRHRRRGAVAGAQRVADRAVRLGTGSRVVLTHDIAQRDNLRVGRHDGVAAVIEKLKGHPLFAHITLLRSERSPIAALVTEMLEEIAGPH